MEEQGAHIQVRHAFRFLAEQVAGIVEERDESVHIFPSFGNAEVFHRLAEKDHRERYRCLVAIEEAALLEM